MTGVELTESARVLLGLPPASSWLRCAECDKRIRRDPLCTDLGVLTLHWMSEHPRKWLEMHPESAEFLPQPE